MNVGVYREEASQRGLRAFGLISLLAVGLLLPIEALYRTHAALQPLLLVYGFQTALGACILIACRRATAPFGQWVSRVLVLGHTVALVVYLSLAPEHPGSSPRVERTEALSAQARACSRWRPAGT